MYTLILYSFLAAGPGIEMPTTVKVTSGPYATLEDCQKAMRKARLEAKWNKQKQIGGTCERGRR